MQTNQHHFQVNEWSDAHTDGLMSVSEQMHLIRMEDLRRNKLQSYVPPVETAPEPYKSAAHAITDLIVTIAPPLVGLVAIGGVVCVMVSAVAAMVGAVFAFVSANAFWIGGGALAVAVLAGLFNRGEKQGVGSRAGTPPQTINVIVNVAGQNVTTNGKAQ